MGPFEKFKVTESIWTWGKFIVAVWPSKADPHNVIPMEEWNKIGTEQRAFIESAIREKLERERRDA
jgi:hypothetical protein